MIPHPYDYPPYTAGDVDEDEPTDVTEFLSAMVDNYVPDASDKAYNESWRKCTKEAA